MLYEVITSCTKLLSSTLIEPTVENLQRQPDLELVCEGSPAYLLMIDSLVASDPDSRDLLRAGSQAYSGYVITSYSIHYTKLYDLCRHDQPFPAR